MLAMMFCQNEAECERNPHVRPTARDAEMVLGPSCRWQFGTLPTPSSLPTGQPAAGRILRRQPALNLAAQRDRWTGRDAREELAVDLNASSDPGCRFDVGVEKSAVEVTLLAIH